MPYASSFQGCLLPRYCHVQSTDAMDERAQIPVTLPRDNPTISYWQDPPDGIADLRSTPSLPQKADVVIVGSGITGAAVAWNLLQSANHDGTSPPAPSGIVMLEARQACSGATGRNGKFVLSRLLDRAKKEASGPPNPSLD